MQPVAPCGWHHRAVLLVVFFSSRSHRKPHGPAPSGESSGKMEDWEVACLPIGPDAPSKPHSQHPHRPDHAPLSACGGRGTGTDVCHWHPWDVSRCQDWSPSATASHARFPSMSPDRRRKAMPRPWPLRLQVFPTVTHEMTIISCTLRAKNCLSG